MLHALPGGEVAGVATEDAELHPLARARGVEGRCVGEEVLDGAQRQVVLLQSVLDLHDEGVEVRALGNQRRALHACEGSWCATGSGCLSGRMTAGMLIVIWETMTRWLVTSYPTRALCV